MSIDGLGRPPAPPASGVSPLAGPAEASASSEPFRAERPAGAAAAEAAGPLARLESGELSLDQYLDMRVDEAVAPFGDRLSASQLEFMKTSLRAELEADPVLVELVRRATGARAGSSEP